MASDIIGVDTLRPLFIAAGAEENKLDIFMRPDSNLDHVMNLIEAIKEKLVFAGLNAVKHTRTLAEYDYRIKGSKIIEVISFEVKPSGNLGESVGELVDNAVLELRDMKNVRTITDALVKINSVENQADDISDQFIERLFSMESDAKEIIKKREIYQVLEDVTDKCEDAANVIESIIVKYA